MRTPELEFSIEAPAYEVPGAALFSHPSHLMDAWSADPEVVSLPPKMVEGGRILFRILDGSSGELGIPFRTRNPRRWLDHRRRIVPEGPPGRIWHDARYDTDRNIAHQVAGPAVRVLLARRELGARDGGPPEIGVILRRGAAGYTKALYEELNIPVLETDCQVQGRFLKVDDPQVRTRVGLALLSGGTYASMALTPAAFAAVPLRSESRPAADKASAKLFIDRVGTRSLINDPEISALLEKRGFVRVLFERLPMSEQMRLSRNARVLVAIHGAAMALMALNPNPGLRVIELFGPGYGVDMYRRYAARMGAHWCAVRGRITPEVVRDLDVRRQPRSHETSSFRVDPGTLEMALDYSERVAMDPAPGRPWDHLWSPS